MKLPGLSKRVATASLLESEEEETLEMDSKSIKFNAFKGLPLAKLTSQSKQEIPESVVFARFDSNDLQKKGDKVIDYDIVLNFNEKGHAEQKITTLSGSELQLVVKPENKVKTVDGYLFLKPKSEQRVSSRDDFKLVKLIQDILNQLVQPVFAETQKSEELKFKDLNSSAMFKGPNFVQDYQNRPLIFVEGANKTGSKNGSVAGVSTTAEAENIASRLVLLKFEYTDPDGDGIYTANIQAPVVEGEYEIVTVMDFEDPNLGKKEIRMITVVDPEGYVYERDGEKETRIPGAIVSIFWLNPESKQYELWLARNYNQENPQITDATGKYSFLVPEGSYYLKVETPGYLDYDGKPFQVKEGSGVHINVEVKTKYWWLKVVDWKTLLLVLIIVLLLYNFYRDKIREKNSLKN